MLSSWETITTEEYRKVRNNFKQLYNLTSQKGMLYDETHDELGFRKDTDMKGNTVKRNHDITSEHRQRCKITNHKYQNAERNETNHTHIVGKTKTFEEEVAKLMKEVDELEEI